jgi:ribonuclease HI
MTLEKIIARIDGGCPNNPGGAGAWAWIVEFVGLGRKLSGGGFIESTTNNYCEYAGIAEAAGFLLRVDELGPEIAFLSDSMLCVQQLNGIWQQKQDSLRDVYSLAQARIAKLRSRVPLVSISWIKRDLNTEADGLCNDILDAHGVVGLSWQTRKKIEAAEAKAKRDVIESLARASEEAGLYDKVILPDDLA